MTRATRHADDKIHIFKYLIFYTRKPGVDITKLELDSLNVTLPYPG